VREQGYHNPNNSNNQIIGLIRLVKIKESRVPTVKLINLDLTLYEQSTIPQDRSDGFGVVGISERLAVTDLQEGISGKKSKKKERVKIMKRSSSSGLGGNGKSDKSNSSKQKGKKLSDKEKAYAEARARIFNSNESSVNSLGGSEHVDNEIVISPPGSANRSADTSPVSGNSANAPANQKATYLVPSQVVSADTGEQIVTTSRTKYAKRDNLPAAATGGAASKVLWRNREQEASDPDFQCRHHPGMLQVMPGHIQYQQQYAPQNGMNPAAANFHYGGAVPEVQSFNRGAGYYGSALPSHHQAADATWHKQEYQFAAHEPRQHQGANGDKRTSPSNEPLSDSNLAQDINLSKDEFPALQ
jgi:hypothetical protein